MSGLPGFLLVVGLIAAGILYVAFRSGGASQARQAATRKPGLLRDQPGDWKDAVYNPRQHRSPRRRE